MARRPSTAIGILSVGRLFSPSLCLEGRRPPLDAVIVAPPLRSSVADGRLDDSGSREARRRCIPRSGESPAPRPEVIMEPLAERNTVHRSSTRRGRFSRVLLIALVLPSLAGRAEADLMQITAPSINSASPDLLDHAASPAMAGVALDRRFEKAVDRSALTLNLTPLGLLGLAGHGGGAEHDPGWASRAVARVTVGGPLQFVDSLRTAHAGHATNHVTSELKLRMLGPPDDVSSTRPLTVGLALTAGQSGHGLRARSLLRDAHCRARRSVRLDGERGLSDPRALPVRAAVGGDQARAGSPVAVGAAQGPRRGDLGRVPVA